MQHRSNPSSAGRPIRPPWLRISHRLNALAVLLLVTSGWRIDNAAPFFPFRRPPDATLGGRLRGALQWHFAALWLLAVNGLVYGLLNLGSGRRARTFFPLSPAVRPRPFGNPQRC
jgi:thiosulfate reductase cytochrome b subunit